MRRLGLALAASVFAISTICSVSAADMPVAVKAPVMVAPVMSWTGFYIGVHGGGGWANSDWGYSNVHPYSALSPAGPATAALNSFDPSGWVGGGQIGYNHQIGQWVLGVEATGSAAGVQQTVLNVVQFPPVATVYVATDIEALFTATGRIGFVPAPQWLLYAKGGYAGGKIKTSGEFVPPTFAGLQLNWTTSEWHHGWTVGVGLEYRVNKQITVGAGYDFIDLTGKNHVGAISGGFITAANQVNHNVQVDLHVVTARVNWLFQPN